MKKLKCECGNCKTCYMREYMKRKREGKPGKKRGPASGGESGDGRDHRSGRPADKGGDSKSLKPEAAHAREQDPDPIAEKESAVLLRVRRPSGIHQVVVLNRVGIPIEANVYMDGWRLCVCVSLGDRNVPEEPAMFYDVKRLQHHRMSFPASSQI